MFRLVSFDIAKALCIILVVIGHYIPSDSPQWYVNLRSWIYPSFQVKMSQISPKIGAERGHICPNQKQNWRRLDGYAEIPKLVEKLRDESMKLLDNDALIA